MYENFMGSHKVQDGQPIAFNVLTRDNRSTFTQEDCVFITKGGKRFMFGTQCVANIGEVLSLCAAVDFLPSDFPNERSGYEDELARYAETPNDEAYYFPSTRFGFNIIDIFSINVFPPQDDEVIVGRKEVVEGGVRYYPESTDNGYCFKDFNAIKAKKGVCYIAECAWDGTKEDFVELTPDNTYKMIHEGGVETYDTGFNSVFDLVHGQFPAFATTANSKLWEKFVGKITDYVFEEVDWCCFSTFLNEMDLYEELNIFLADEFVEYTKKRIKQDDIDVEINDDFADELFDFLGEECYRNEDYSLTDWDALIDMWESQYQD